MRLQETIASHQWVSASLPLQQALLQPSSTYFETVCDSTSASLAGLASMCSCGHWAFGHAAGHTCTLASATELVDLWNWSALTALAKK